MVDPRHVRSGPWHAVLIAIWVAIAPAAASGSSASLDARIIALDLTGELLPPPDLAARVDADLVAIRDHDPYFVDFHVFPDWQPGILLVRLTADAWDSFQAGDYHGWDALNAEYGLTVMPDVYPRERQVPLRFTELYHPEALGAIYSGVPGIESAGAALQTDGPSDIDAEVPAAGGPIGTYTFAQNWAECGPGGCYFFQHYWVFEVSPSGVVLVEQSGSPLPVEEQTWGGIKNLFRDR